MAQEEQFTVSAYIQTQQALLSGVTELLNLSHIAEQPDDVAEGIEYLTKYAAALVYLKGQLNADELATAQGNLESDPSAQTIGAAFIAAVNKLNDNQFYNSPRLASALQDFTALLAQM